MHQACPNSCDLSKSKFVVLDTLITVIRWVRL